MIKREDIDRLPTAVRDSIKQHLEQCVSKADKAKLEAALAYAMTTDEKHRSAALIAQGEHDAFLVLFNIFK